MKIVTWNPFVGCSPAGPLCAGCKPVDQAAGLLARSPAYRGLTRPGANGPEWTGEVRLREDVLSRPFHWRDGRSVEVCNMGDAFHENVKDEWLDRLFAVIALNPRHEFLIVSHRRERAKSYLSVGELELVARWKRGADAIGQDPEGVTWPLNNLLLNLLPSQPATAAA